MANEALQAAMMERAKREKARRVQAAPAQAAAGPGLLENIWGQGEIDTPGERLGATINDVATELGKGIGRGVTGLATIPQGLGSLLDIGVEKLTGVPMQSALPDSGAMANQATANVMPRAPETTAGEYAATVGEFIPGAAVGGGLSAVPKYAIAAGLGSEAAGQLTEGTAAEPYARLVGAVAAPSAVNVGSKAFRALFTKTAQAPTLEGLRALKTEAYRAADDANISFTPKDTNTIIAKAQRALADADFVPEVDAQTKAAFKILTSKADQPMTLGQLDKVRQGLWRRYNADKSQVAILDMIDAIDDTIQTSPAGGEMMAAARLANSKFKKSELLENAFQKAADQTAATGSGGNIVNKYRQAVTSIINTPKTAKWFSKEEIDQMRQFVRGSGTENALRLGGKLSPSGNGLMAALNLGAVAVDPTMLGVSAAASAAKALSDRAGSQGASNLQRMMATGSLPAAQPTQLPGRIGGLVSGLLSGD